MDVDVRELLRQGAVTQGTPDVERIRQRGRRRRAVRMGVVAAVVVLASLVVADLVIAPTGRRIELAPADQVLPQTEPSGTVEATLTTPLLTSVEGNGPVAAWVDDNTPIYLFRDEDGWYGVSALSGHPWFGLPTLVAPCTAQNTNITLLADTLGASVFTDAGVYVTGPAPSDLDRWDVAVVDDRFVVEGPVRAEGRSQSEPDFTGCNLMGADWVDHLAEMAAADAFPLPVHEVPKVTVEDLPADGPAIVHAWHEFRDGRLVACDVLTDGQCPQSSLLISDGNNGEPFLLEQWTFVEAAGGEVVQAWPLTHGTLGTDVGDRGLPVPVVPGATVADARVITQSLARAEAQLWSLDGRAVADVSPLWTWNPTLGLTTGQVPLQWQSVTDELVEWNPADGWSAPVEPGSIRLVGSWAIRARDGIRVLFDGDEIAGTDLPGELSTSADGRVVNVATEDDSWWFDWDMGATGGGDGCTVADAFADFNLWLRCPGDTGSALRPDVLVYDGPAAPGGTRLSGPLSPSGYWENGVRGDGGFAATWATWFDAIDGCDTTHVLFPFDGGDAQTLLDGAPGRVLGWDGNSVLVHVTPSGCPEAPGSGIWSIDPATGDETLLIPVDADQARLFSEGGA